MNRLKRHRHPNIPAFWAHPKLGCHEVAAREGPQTFARSRPDLFGGELDDVFGHGWISAVRWAGKEDFWL